MTVITATVQTHRRSLAVVGAIVAIALAVVAVVLFKTSPGQGMHHLVGAYHHLRTSSKLSSAASTSKPEPAGGRCQRPPPIGERQMSANGSSHPRRARLARGGGGRRSSLHRYSSRAAPQGTRPRLPRPAAPRPRWPTPRWRPGSITKWRCTRRTTGSGRSWCRPTGAQCSSGTTAAPPPSTTTSRRRPKASCPPWSGSPSAKAGCASTSHWRNYCPPTQPR